MSERKILLDPGHYEGYNRGICMAEGTNNWHYAQVLRTELAAAGFQVDLTKPNIGANPSLATRGGMSAGYDAFLSLHSDAGNSASRGVLILDAIRSPNTALAAKLAVEIAKAMGTTNRGVLYRKNADGWSVTKTPQGGTDYYGVLRASKSKVAMLIEHGFHTNVQDCEAFKTRHKQIAQATTRVLAEHFGISKPTITTGVNDQNILGAATITAEAAEAWILSKISADTPKLTCALSDLVRHFWAESKAEGVRPEVALSLSIKETGFWRYGGIVQPEQNNFGGLAAFNDNAKGDAANFADCQTGARAVVQHLRGYATKEPLKQANVDPRYQALVDKNYLGTAPTVHGLSGKWAWPGYDRKKHASLAHAYAAGETYGQDIVRTMEQMIAFGRAYKPNDPPAEKPAPYHIGVYAHSTADLGGVLRIIAQVDGAVLVDASRVNPTYYKEIIQVGGTKDDKATVHLSGKNRTETDAAVTVWLQEKRQK